LETVTAATTETEIVSITATATEIEMGIAGIATGTEVTDMEDEMITLARDTMKMTGMMTLELKEGTKGTHISSRVCLSVPSGGYPSPHNSRVASFSL
jgi:hypothetical protein